MDYNGNRSYKPDVPFPGVAYLTRVRDDLSLTVGVPVTGIELSTDGRARCFAAHTDPCRCVDQP